ncbi:MAG TPA: triose-phosphate isomerase [Chitinophagaceae bacterium]|nr:MAG: triosephosphate isomerase [Bacteroidetes bacterium OLB11]HMN32531.1 triose-phosphate isomerase [Chitinophagaceae bacterium]
MRRKIVAANWKMNLSIKEAKDLAHQILTSDLQLNEKNSVVLCVPFTHLHVVNEELSKHKVNSVYLGAQNCSDKLQGAFTGEISPLMLQNLNTTHVIIGHSERRQYQNESNELLKSKVETLISQNMQVLFCCGEPLEIRKNESQNSYVAEQLTASLFHLNAEQLTKHIVIAYEPIWAIGTGLTASPQQAQDMHAFIRSLLSEKYGNEIAQQIPILYGGSCNAQNAKELFSNQDVDGGLIGGAALKADTFLPIIHAMN